MTNRKIYILYIYDLFYNINKISKLDQLRSPELSEKEEIIQNYQGEIEEFKNELPITKEEAEEICNSFEQLETAFDEITRPLGLLKEEIEEWIDRAKAAGFLKRNEKNQTKLKNIIEKIMRDPQFKNILEKNEETWRYYVNSDSLFNIINSLDKKDRKFIKKIAKAIIKTYEKKENERIKLHEKEGKTWKKINKHYRKEKKSSIDKKIK